MSTLTITTMSGSKYTLVQDNTGGCFLCGGRITALTKVNIVGKLECGLPMLAVWGDNSIIRTSPVLSISAV